MINDDNLFSELDQLQENLNLTNDRLTPISTTSTSLPEHELSVNASSQELISSSSSDSGLSSDNIDLYVFSCKNIYLFKINNDLLFFFLLVI